MTIYFTKNNMYEITEERNLFSTKASLNGPKVIDFCGINPKEGLVRVPKKGDNLFIVYNDKGLERVAKTSPITEVV